MKREYYLDSYDRFGYKILFDENLTKKQRNHIARILRRLPLELSFEDPMYISFKEPNVIEVKPTEKGHLRSVKTLKDAEYALFFNEFKGHPYGKDFKGHLILKYGDHEIHIQQFSDELTKDMGFHRDLKRLGNKKDKLEAKSQKLEEKVLSLREDKEYEQQKLNETILINETALKGWQELSKRNSSQKRKSIRIRERMESEDRLSKERRIYESVMETDMEIERLIKEDLGLSIPENEQAVRDLFAKIAYQLGYKILNSTTRFPDYTLEKENEIIKAEAEFKSSGIQDHYYGEEDCDLTICWLHNLEIPTTDVLELRNLKYYNREKPFPMSADLPKIE